MEKKYSIIVQSCDAYEDVWKPFFVCLRQNWVNLNCPIFLNTETKEFKLKGLDIRTIHYSGEKKWWGDRLVNCLKQIQSDYVISLFDDFLLEKEVNQKILDDCIRLMDDNQNIDVFYLIHIFPELEDCSGRQFVEVPIGKDYRLNSAPGIWKKSSLIKYTGKKDSPWAWEYFGTSRTEKEKKSLFYVLNKPVPDVIPYNYSLGGAIHMGKWVKDVISPLDKQYGFKIDFSKRGFWDKSDNKNMTVKQSLKFFCLGMDIVGIKIVFRYHKFVFSMLLGMAIGAFKFMFGDTAYIKVRNAIKRRKI